MAVAAHVTATIQFGIAGMVVALAGVLLVAGRVWADRRQPQDETTSVHVARAAGDVTEQQPISDEKGVALAQRETADFDSPDDERDEPEDNDVAVSIEPAEPADELVRVIPGRKRFHERGCSSLVGRESEELTREEAEEEGFTPCSICCGNRRNIKKVG